MIRILLLSSMVFFTQANLWARVKIPAENRIEGYKMVVEACKSAIDIKNRAEVCDCIAKNHVEQAQFTRALSVVMGQLRWVSDFYLEKLSQSEFEKDPYSVGGTSGMINYFDRECKADPSFRMTFK